MIRGKDGVERMRRELIRVVTVGKPLRSYSNVVDAVKLHLHMRIPKGLDFRGFASYSVAQERVLVVRLQGNRGVDYVVRADLWGGVILDSEEKYPLKLTPGSFRLCGGGSGCKRITEVREIFDLKQ